MSSVHFFSFFHMHTHCISADMTLSKYHTSVKDTLHKHKTLTINMQHANSGAHTHLHTHVNVGNTANMMAM